MKNVPIPEVTISQLVTAERLNAPDPDFLVSEEVTWMRPSYAYRHAFYMVAICTGGFGKATFNLQEYTFSQYTLFSVSPQLIIQVLEQSPDIKVSHLVFNKQFLSGNHINSNFLDTLNFFKPGAFTTITLSKQDAESLLALFSQIREKNARTEHPYRKEIAKSLTISLLYEIEALSQQYSSVIKRKLSRKEELNKQFQDLLFRHFKEERTVKFYAGALFVSPKYLMEVIKEVTGRTAGELIDEAVILEAKVLLKIPELNVSRVSDMLHFPDQSFFGKFFKNHAGFSPSEYRNLTE